MNLSRLSWAVWAILPVLGLAYHFGPGQTSFQHDRAVGLYKAAQRLEQDALALQATAYDKHLEALSARRAAFVTPTPEAQARASAATDEESRAFQAASAGWRLAAEAYGHILDVAQGAASQTLQELRWSRSRALVRAGDIWTGIGELETVLAELGSTGRADSTMARATREELAAAYYYGARLMRLSGEPVEEWMIESGKARQHFRYLAEQAQAKGLGHEVVESQQRNVELVLNLEQSTLLEVQGKPLPKDSPMCRNGNRPGRGNAGKRPQPPQQRDGRGAGGAEEVNTGW